MQISKTTELNQHIKEDLFTNFNRQEPLFAIAVSLDPNLASEDKIDSSCANRHRKGVDIKSTNNTA